MICTVRFAGGAVEILDQSQLPQRVAFERCRTVEDVAAAIRLLKVRGAPLIGVVAAFGLALAMHNYKGSRDLMDDYFYACKNLLASTRPTAVNLFWALQRMEHIYRLNNQKDPGEVAALLLEAAEEMFAEDIAINRAIGEYGQDLLPAGAQVMTICNAGTLATCGYGTALGVIRSAARRGKIKMVWICETRPVLQGARLTVWELMQDSIPVTLITDSMAGYTMKLGYVDAIVTGADRIAANGDTANKIGTFSLAVLAQYHNIPFYIAAPSSTVDISLESGDAITIEERHQDEVRCIAANCLTVPEVEVFNPAFDITPRHLITGIITEGGVIRAPFAEGLKKICEGR